MVNPIVTVTRKLLYENIRNSHCSMQRSGDKEFHFTDTIKQEIQRKHNGT